MTRSIVAWLTLGACVLLTGCQNRFTNVQGKVIRGDLSFILVVDAADERLKSDGIQGANVRISKGVDRGSTLLGDETTDPKGDFSIPIKDSAALLRDAEFSATKDGFAPSSATMPIPPAAQRLLVILKPAAASRTR